MQRPPIKYFLALDSATDTYIPLFYQRAQEPDYNEVIILSDTKHATSHYIIIDLYMTKVFFHDRFIFRLGENFSNQQFDQPHGVHMISQRDLLINMTDKSYTGLQEQISYIESELLLGTFQEIENIYCSYISAVILPGYSCDIKMLMELFPFIFDEIEEYYRLDLYLSDLPVIDDNEFTVKLLNIPDFETFGDEDSEESDFRIRLIITSNLIRIKVFGDRDVFLEANMALLRLISTLLDNKKSLGSDDSFI